MPGEDAHSSGRSIPALRPASFKTRRLFVRSLCADDLEEFSRNRARPEVAQYQSWGVDYTLQDAQRLLDAQLLTAYGRGGSWHQLAIVRCEDGQLLGDLAVHFCDFEDDSQAEVGFTLMAEHRRQGYGQEALAGLLRHLFLDRGMRRVTATTDERNQRAVTLLRAVGMRQEALLRESSFWKGELCSEYLFAMLASEFRLAARDDVI